MADWRQTYDPRDLSYLSAKAKQIRDTASLLGVPAMGLVGGVAREMAYARNADPWWATFSEPMKDFLTSNEVDPSPSLMPGGVLWKPITHQTLAAGFARSNLPGGSIEPGADKIDLTRLKLRNPVLWDVGPGHVNIRTAITMLQNYNRMFPDSDPLDLKQYNQRYDLLVRDLKNPDTDTTVKIAGLVAREGQDFYGKTMTPERWAALSEDQRAAALTRYYVSGPERMESDFQQSGGDPNAYMPDLSAAGSNTYLYTPDDGSAPNPGLLKDALFPPVRKQDKLEMPPARRGDSGPGENNVTLGETATVQPAAVSPVPVQTGSSGLPPQVVANANHIAANGFAITPRTIYVSHVIGPQRAVDLFRTGTTSSPDVPSPDAATGRQVLNWARALHGLPPLPPVPGGSIAQPDNMPTSAAPPAGPSATMRANDASDDSSDVTDGLVA
jgi:hypothetical protein